MDYKTYTREEYLTFCKKRGVKNPLPESRRNKFTESGYPTMSVGGITVNELSADEYYKLHG